MSTKKHAPAEYPFLPEPFQALEDTFYDLQEYHLLHQVVESGAEQFVGDAVSPAISVSKFIEFRKVQPGRPEILLTRKALRELKIMRSLDYSDCVDVLRGVTFGHIDPESYGQAFRYAHTTEQELNRVIANPYIPPFIGPRLTNTFASKIKRQ